MFVYTVCNAPNAIQKEPCNRISAVSKVEAARPTDPAWLVHKQLFTPQPPKTGDWTSPVFAQPSANESFSQQARASQQRMGDLVLTGSAKQLLLEYRKPKSNFPLNVSDFMEKLEKIRKTIQAKRAG